MYRDEIHVQPHDFAEAVTKVGNGENGHVIQGLEMIRVEPTTERNSTGVSADGFTWDVKNNDRRGIITIQIPENSPSNSVLWDLYEADEAFAFSHSDPACPTLKINNSNVRINRPPIERGADVKMIEYKFTAKYLNYRGGSYELVSAS